MLLRPIFLASPVYYQPETFADDAQVILNLIKGFDRHTNYLAEPAFVDSVEAAAALLTKADLVIPLLIPLSGGTQKWMLQIAKANKQSLLWMYYPNDALFSDSVQQVIQRIAAKNALPAVMDVWSYLNNRKCPVEMVYDEATYLDKAGLFASLVKIVSSRLLIVGYTQQWVVSTTVNQRLIEDKLGIHTVHIGLEELLEEYRQLDASAQTRAFAADYIRQASRCIEPNQAQVEAAYKMYLALIRLLGRYQCNSLAISCFSLMKTLGVTSCLALSLLNDDQRYTAACEGDLDAAVSMIIGKNVTGRPVFMGNPVFNLNGTLDLVHCTAPRKLLSEAESSYEVRSHHETGVSVAQRIELPSDTGATLFRIGNELSEATLYAAKLIDNPRQDTCRTQFRFMVESSSLRLAQLLGCHQLVVFGEYEAKLRHVFEKYLSIRVR